MTYNEGVMRQAQEDLAKMIRGGFHEVIAKGYRVLYLAFRKEGFSRRQALNLTKFIMGPERNRTTYNQKMEE